MGKVRRHYIHCATLRVSLVFDLPIVCHHLQKGSRAIGCLAQTYGVLPSVTSMCITPGITGAM